MKKTNPKTEENEVELVEFEESYTIDKRDREAAQKYFPIAAYIGIILAILLGAIIIGISILLSSGRVGNTLLGEAFSNKDKGAVGIDSKIQNSETKPLSTNATVEIQENYPMLGSKDAPVTIIEFADFQCPFCKEFQDKAFQQIKTKYIDTGLVKFYFLHFPFLGPESDLAANASECARKQNKFWEFHDLLYKAQKAENSGALGDTVLSKLAKESGMNQVNFNSCISNDETTNTVQMQLQVGKEAGVVATPTLLINGKKIEGSNPFISYQSVIEKALKSR